MKIPTNKVEIAAMIDAAEKVLAALVERKLPRIIPGVSANLPSPTVPLNRKDHQQPSHTSLDKKENL